MIHDVVRLRVFFKLYSASCTSGYWSSVMIWFGKNWIKQGFVSLYLLGCRFIECSNRTDGGRLVLAMVE